MMGRPEDPLPESPTQDRLIAHVDMDAFFVSVERMERPRSRKPAGYRRRQHRKARRGLRRFL